MSVQLGWDIGELGCEGGNGLPVAFECLAFVVGEVELFEHLLDSALDLERPAALTASRNGPQVRGPAGPPYLGALPASPRLSPGSGAR